MGSSSLAQCGDACAVPQISVPQFGGFFGDLFPVISVFRQQPMDLAPRQAILHCAATRNRADEGGAVWTHARRAKGIHGVAAGLRVRFSACS
jgi:hypothetical protein